jgi:hypothetical protein
MKFLLIGLSLLLLFTTTQARPQANTGRLDVQVTHVNSTEGIPEALITLQGPFPASSTGLFYTPSSALTPDMREQIDITVQVRTNGNLRRYRYRRGAPDGSRASTAFKFRPWGAPACKSPTLELRETSR